jgi:hypothetical protein
MRARLPRKGRKWRPADGVREFVEFTDWAAIAATLPEGAPPNAKTILQAHGRRLWDQRCGRTARAATIDLKRLAASLLTAAAEAERGRHAWATALTEWAQETERELKLALAYEGRRDPDREEFLFALLQTYRSWGGSLGGGKQYRYLPPQVAEFVHLVGVEVLGPDAPQRDSVWKIVARYRRVPAAATFGGEGGFRDNPDKVYVSGRDGEKKRGV